MPFGLNGHDNEKGGDRAEEKFIEGLCRYEQECVVGGGGCRYFLYRSCFLLASE